MGFVAASLGFESAAPQAVVQISDQLTECLRGLLRRGPQYPRPRPVTCVIDGQIEGGRSDAIGDILDTAPLRGGYLAEKDQGHVQVVRMVAAPLRQLRAMCQCTQCFPHLPIRP